MQCTIGSSYKSTSNGVKHASWFKGMNTHQTPEVSCLAFERFERHVGDRALADDVNKQEYIVIIIKGSAPFKLFWMYMLKKEITELKLLCGVCISRCLYLNNEEWYTYKGCFQNLVSQVCTIQEIYLTCIHGVHLLHYEHIKLIKNASPQPLWMWLQSFKGTEMA